jgi:hypothetical protein
MHPSALYKVVVLITRLSKPGWQVGSKYTLFPRSDPRSGFKAKHPMFLVFVVNVAPGPGAHNTYSLEILLIPSPTREERQEKRFLSTSSVMVEPLYSILTAHNTLCFINQSVLCVFHRHIMYEDEDFEDDASVRSATSKRAASRQQKPVINATEGEEGYEDDYAEDAEHHEDYDDDFSAAEAQVPGSSSQVRASVSITAKAALPSEQLEEASGGDYEEEDFEDTKSLISAARPAQKLSAPEGPAEDEEYDHDFEANPTATPKAAVPGPSKTQDYEDEFEENPQPVSSPTPEPGPVHNGTPFKSSQKPVDQDVMAPDAAPPPVTVPTAEVQPPQGAALRRRSSGTAQPPQAGAQETQGAEILAQDNGE